MRNRIIKHLLLFVLLLSSIILHATPGDTDGTDNLEGVDTPAAPIDDWILLGMCLGLLLGYYILKNQKQISE